MGHADARLTVHGKLLLIRRVTVASRPVAHVAKELGIWRQCPRRRVARYRAESPTGLRERSSRPCGE